MLEAVGLIGRGALPPAEILAIRGIIAVDPPGAPVLLEGQDMGGHPVEEPSVVADDHGAPGEALQGVLQGPERVDVQVVRRLVQEQDVSSLGHGPGQVDPVPLAA